MLNMPITDMMGASSYDKQSRAHNNSNMYMRCNTDANDDIFNHSSYMKTRNPSNQILNNSAAISERGDKDHFVVNIKSQNPMPKTGGKSQSKKMLNRAVTAHGKEVNFPRHHRHQTLRKQHKINNIVDDDSIEMPYENDSPRKTDNSASRGDARTLNKDSQDFTLVKEMTSQPE